MESKMVHYVGLDVSLKQTSICVVNQLESIVREGVVDSEPGAIAAFVRLNAPGAVRIGRGELCTEPIATYGTKKRTSFHSWDKKEGELNEQTRRASTATDSR
jgi:hypothetical protein